MPNLLEQLWWPYWAQRSSNGFNFCGRNLAYLELLQVAWQSWGINFIPRIFVLDFNFNAIIVHPHYTENQVMCQAIFQVVNKRYKWLNSDNEKLIILTFRLSPLCLYLTPTIFNDSQHKVSIQTNFNNQ